MLPGKVGIDDLFCHRCGRGTSVTGVFQDDGDCNFRVFIRCEADKECVVLEIGRHTLRLSGILFLRKSDHLGGPRLSADIRLFSLQDRARPPLSFTTPHKALLMIWIV